MVQLEESEINLLNSPLNEDLDDSSNHLLSGLDLILVTVAFVLINSLAALDLTIVATSLVTITSYFNAVSDIAWVTSAFFIVQASFILIYGKLLNIARPKFVLLTAAGIFEFGSLLSAVAPSANFLICARAISGLGASGIWISILAIIGRISTLTQRPILIGIFVSAIGICSVIGPIIGGVLSDGVSASYFIASQDFFPFVKLFLDINLPLGGVSMLLIFILLPNLPSLAARHDSILKTWLALDWIGTVLSILGIFLFTTGIQWGGNTKPWNDPGVILTTVFGVILTCLFFAWETRKGSDAILRTAMFRKRNIVGSFFISGFMHWSLMLATYYMPIIYQLRGHSVIKSSTDILPLILIGIAGGAISGGCVAATGQVWIWLFFPPLLGSVAYGFLFASDVDTSLAKLVGYQVLVGFGLGAPIQNCFIMAQVEYAKEEELIPQATSLITFAGIGFSAVGLSASGALFSQALRSEVAKLNLNLPEPLRSRVLESIDAVLALPDDLKDPLIKAYNTAVTRIFISGIVITTLGGLSALLVERKAISLKSLAPGGGSGTKNSPSTRSPSSARSSRYYEEIYRDYKAEPYIPLIQRTSTASTLHVI